jgi:hypothetical protein
LSDNGERQQAWRGPEGDWRRLKRKLKEPHKSDQFRGLLTRALAVDDNIVDLDTVGVTGSIPVSPTMKAPESRPFVVSGVQRKIICC